MQLKRLHHRMIDLALAVALTFWSFGCGNQGAPPQAASKPKAPAESASIPAEKIEQALAAAQEYLSSQDHAKAIAILITLIDRAPDEVRARELYGQALTMAALQAEHKGEAVAASEHRAKAYQQYVAAVAIEPNLAGLQHSTGLMAMAAGQPQRALEHFRKAAALDPRSAQYPLFEAQILIQEKRYDEARQSLQRALSIDPDEPIAYASLAMIALDLNQFGEALQHMAQARQRNPSDIGLRAQEARVHRVSGDPKRAIELLAGLNDQQRAGELVTFEIASSYSQLGDHLAAARAWQQCYQAYPTASRAWLAAVRTGQSLVDAGELDQAAMWLEQARLGAPDSPEVHALAQRISESSHTANPTN
jgi:tetratricopeptide (TPR) repeat protein